MLIAMMKEQNSMTLGDLCHLCEYHLDYIPEVAVKMKIWIRMNYNYGYTYLLAVGSYSGFKSLVLIALKTSSIGAAL